MTHVQIRDGESQTAFTIPRFGLDAADQCYARYFGGADEDNPHADVPAHARPEAALGAEEEVDRG